LRFRAAAGPPHRRRSRPRSTVEPVFDIIKNVLGFKHFFLRGIENVKTEWLLVTLAYNCKRLFNLKTG
jgi:hypothetical protein